MKQPDPPIPRPRLLDRTLQYIEEAPVTVLLGARQTGKTTLSQMAARSVIKNRDMNVHTFDLERAASRAALSTPEITLEGLRGLIIIDEIQRLPQLFETLRPLTDRPETPARFLVLGSASPGLVRGVSESLAGRTLFIAVPGFSLDEIGVKAQEQLWVRGQFPRPGWQHQKQPVCVGVRRLSLLFWSGIFRNGEFVCRLKICDGSGQCWPIITVRCGMLPNWPDPSEHLPRRPCTTAIFSPADT